MFGKKKKEGAYEEKKKENNDKRTLNNRSFAEKATHFAKDLFYRQKVPVPGFGEMGFNVLHLFIYLLIGANVIFVAKYKLPHKSFLPIDDKKAPYCCKNGDEWPKDVNKSGDSIQSALSNVWNLDFGSPYTLAYAEKPTPPGGTMIKGPDGTEIPVPPSFISKIMWLLKYWFLTIKATIGHAFLGGWLNGRKVGKTILSFIAGLMQQEKNGKLMENYPFQGIVFMIFGYLLFYMFISGWALWPIIVLVCAFVGSLNVGFANWLFAALFIVLLPILLFVCAFVGGSQTLVAVILFTLYPLAIGEGRGNLIENIMKYNKWIVTVFSLVAIMSAWNNFGYEFGLGGLLFMLLIGGGTAATSAMKNREIKTTHSLGQA